MGGALNWVENCFLLAGFSLFLLWYVSLHTFSLVLSSFLSQSFVFLRSCLKYVYGSGAGTYHPKEHKTPRIHSIQ